LKTVRLAITGSPGTGKHTCARLVAGLLNAEILDINKIAVDNNAVLKKTGKGLDIDVKKLGRALASQLKKSGSYVIVGHLAPYVLKRDSVDMAVVLRRSPARLEETLKERGYARKKINENVSAEILGISLYDLIKAFGRRKVAEFDTTGRTPEQTADEIVATLQGKKPRRAGSVDWLAVVSEQEVQKFFAY
jgi:adenylate kinase